jgi:hypothetical protein
MSKKGKKGKGKGKKTKKGEYNICPYSIYSTYLLHNLELRQNARYRRFLYGFVSLNNELSLIVLM